jgi:hypothetical protein
VARKNAADVTLAEHVARIGKLGGVARAQKLSDEELSAIGRKAGLVGGKRRAETLSKKRRSEIARKAAETRWGKKQP